MTLTFSRVTLAGPLWTVEEAKIHLRETGAANDADIAQKLAAAQEGILAVLGTGADPSWTAATAPEEVKNYILRLLLHYYENRGDDLGLSNRDEAVIWSDIRLGLSKYRDPTIG